LCIHEILGGIKLFIAPTFIGSMLEQNCLVLLSQLPSRNSLVGLNEFGFRRLCDRLVGLRKPFSLVIGKPMNDPLQEERSSTGISAFSSCKPWSRHEVTGRLVIRRGGRVGRVGSPEETLEAEEAEVGLVFYDASSSKLPSFSCFRFL
jgi:hypothetical protein